MIRGRFFFSLGGFNAPFQEEINEANGLVFEGELIIVQASLRKEMLHKLHEGHLGRDKCLATAREILFWPGMSSQIVDIVAKCGICNEFRHSQQKEPMIPHSMPKLPWEKLGVDMFHHNGKTFLILVDYYSKFFEVSLLSSLRARDVIVQMKSQFARHGVPREVISDNGPQFSCTEFASFARSWEFQHTTSSPRYPQSNGMVERAIQTIKTLLKKAAATGLDPYIALMQYRNTPFPDGPSPAQLLMGRRLRTRLPATDDYLKPRVPDLQKMPAMVNQRQARQKRSYDKTALMAPRPTLQPGASIRMQTERGSNWKPATVVSAASAPRSYLVKTPDGAIYRRNRNMLRETKETFVMPDPYQLEGPVSDERQGEGDEEAAVEPPPAAREIPRHTTRYGRQIRIPARYPDVERR